MSCTQAKAHSDASSSASASPLYEGQRGHAGLSIALAEADLLGLPVARPFPAAVGSPPGRLLVATLALFVACMGPRNFMQ